MNGKIWKGFYMTGGIVFFWGIVFLFFFFLRNVAHLASWSISTFLALYVLTVAWRPFGFDRGDFGFTRALYPRALVDERPPLMGVVEGLRGSRGVCRRSIVPQRLRYIYIVMCLLSSTKFELPRS